jgi:hypothetical protein
LFKEYSDFPHELNSRKDMFYFAHWLYPDEIPYDVAKHVLDVYKGVLAGKRKFSMCFFDDDFAMERAEICLLAAINSHGFANVKQLYDFFSSDKGDTFIKSCKLDKPMKMYYKTPLKFLHFTLPEEYQNEYLYKAYKRRNEIVQMTKTA